MIGVSLVWDKVLLSQARHRSVVNYVFWLGGMSVFGAILAFFGMTIPRLWVILTALGAGAIHMAAIYFYYSALNAGEASETPAIMGGLSPLATALIAYPLLNSTISGLSLWGFGLMTGGGFFMFASERIPLKSMLPLVALSAGLFGFTNVLQKMAFNASDFITGYVFFTAGTFGAALLLLVRPRWRHEIFRGSEEAQPNARFWYFVNRLISGLGSFLIFLAISRANPAVVDSISGFRYAVIFACAYVITRFRPRWFKEDFSGWAVIAKTIATALIVAGLVLTGIAGGSKSTSGGGGPAAAFATPTGQYAWRLSRSHPFSRVLSGSAGPCRSPCPMQHECSFG